MLGNLRVLYFLLRGLTRARQDLIFENMALRQQVLVLSRQSHPKLQPADRLFWVWLSRAWSGWHSALLIVRPETVIRWHRWSWRHYWTWKSKHPKKPGRPRIAPEVRQLILRMAVENQRWGAVRIVGELRKLGLRVSARTVRRYLRRVRRRPPSQSGELSSRITQPRSGLLTSSPFNPDLQDAVRLPLHRARPAKAGLLQPDCEPDGGLGMAPANRGYSLGRTARLPD